MGQNKGSNTDNAISDSGRPSYEEIRGRVNDLILQFFRDFFGTDDITPAKIARDVSLNTWHGCLKFVNYEYIGKIDKMEITRKPGQGRGLYNMQRYDMDIMEDLADIYSDLCSAYDKPQSAVAFSDFAGVSYQLLNYWKGQKKGDALTSRRNNVYKKIIGDRREAITNRVLDGGARTLGAVTMYNNEVLPGAGRNDSGGLISGDGLPRLALPGGDNLGI